MKKTDELVWVQNQNPNKATKKKFRSLTWKDDAKQQTAAKRRSIADRTPAVAGSSQDANAGSSKDAVVGEIIYIRCEAAASRQEPWRRPRSRPVGTGRGFCLGQAAAAVGE